MENELLSIGRLAALSGLTVSALRFYDGAQVLMPAVVDPSSGYRYYRLDQVPTARLVAHLRRIGLPLDDMRLMLAQPEQARRVLDAQLARLEAGLADVRREISAINQLIEKSEIPVTTCTLSAAELIQALREVRFAVGADPELPMLLGVFLESEDDRIRLVATDRFRLAVSSIANPDRAELTVLLPTAAVDRLLAGPADGSVTLALESGSVTLRGKGIEIDATVPDVEFPTYRPGVTPTGQVIDFDAAVLRSALAGAVTETRHDHGVEYELSRLTVSAAGVVVGETEDPQATVVGVNREFLLQALEAGDQLTLELDGPIAPLAIRNPERTEAWSLLMPVRLDQPA